MFKYKKYYTYDALNQMKSERKMNQGLTSRLYEYQYQFDAAGNRTQMKYFDGSTTTTTSYTHNDGNQLTARTVGNHEYSYSYDNNGNMTYEEDIPGPVREFTWNEDDRLTGVVRDEYGSASYVYDALGRRIVRTSGTTSTFYYYDGLTVIAEKQKVGQGNWDWQRIFTVAPGVIGNISRISEKSGENWSDAYYHYDAIGNVVLRTNGYGSVLESLDQDAYGNVQIGSQSGYHLTTKEYDSIPELYYFWQRWYDKSSSNFSSIAPLPKYLEHQYSYTQNNPINYFDPTGETWDYLLGIGGAFIGGCVGGVGAPIGLVVGGCIGYYIDYKNDCATVATKACKISCKEHYQKYSYNPDATKRVLDKCLKWCDNHPGKGPRDNPYTSKGGKPKPIVYPK